MDETLVNGGAAQEPATQEEKTTYTKEEVEALLQKEADKRVSAALKKAEFKKEQAVKEAQKLAAMNEEEKYKYQLEQKEKELAEREQRLSILENTTEASKILAEKGISVALVDMVVAADAETMKEKIDLLDREFKASVKAEVEKRLASNTPKRNLPPDNALSKEQFLKLPVNKMQELYNSNPDLYKKFMGE